MSLALGITKNRADAEDAVQNAFLNVVKHIHRFRGGNGYGFLMKITQNAALDVLRARGRRAEVDIDCCFSLSSSDGYDEERRVSALSLEQAIARLPAYGKRLIFYRYYMDYTLREMAAKEKKTVAIGEIGLDYYWDEPDREIQKKWFVRQLELAKETGLPVVIHSREAAADTA